METVDVEFEEKCRIVAGLSMAEMHFKIHQDGTLRLVMDDISMPAGGCVAGGDLEPAAYSNFPILDRIAVATEEAIQKEINAIQKEMKEEAIQKEINAIQKEVKNDK